MPASDLVTKSDASDEDRFRMWFTDEAQTRSREFETRAEAERWAESNRPWRGFKLVRKPGTLVGRLRAMAGLSQTVEERAPFARRD
jgi:hypothetical protein